MKSGPLDKSLPYFAYGLLKPGELAHKQIAPFLAKEPFRVSVKGILWVRDGLPLLDLTAQEPVVGFLCFFKDTESAYAAINAFEPDKQYYWEEVVTIPPPRLRANTLIGRKHSEGSVDFDSVEWSASLDPVFNEGLRIVEDTIRDHARDSFASAPPHCFDWRRLFILQMAYLLLWSAIERYAALSYGPMLNPEQKIKKLGCDPTFASALRDVVKRTDRVIDSRDPDKHEDLDPRKPDSSAEYYYQVRNNLSHRGKGAWKDGETVRSALVELKEIFSQMLNTKRVRS